MGAGTQSQIKRLVCEAAASGEVLGTVDVCGGEQVQAAMAKAMTAQASWARLALEQRCERLLSLRDTLVDRADDLIGIISRECGKPRQEALVHEVMMAVDLAAFYAKRAPRILAPREIDLHLFKHRKSYVHYAPVGVVAIIGPANYPMAIPAEAAITALIAGNAVLLKPSERGTLVALKLKEVFDSSGCRPTCCRSCQATPRRRWRMLDARPDKVVFTGSQAVGRKVAALCGERLIPCIMELGGKGALIVCEDAEIERAARAIVFAGFANGGQVCLGVQRVYAHAAIYDALLERVIRLTCELRQGDPALGMVDVGAVASEAQLVSAEEAVKDAVAKGATLCRGGQRLQGKGRFFAPTVLAGCTPDCADHARRGAGARGGHRARRLRRGGYPACERLALRSGGPRVHARQAARSRHRRPFSRRHRHGQRRAHGLRLPRGAVRRREAERLRTCPRRRGAARDVRDAARQLQPRPHLPAPSRSGSRIARVRIARCAG